MTHFGFAVTACCLLFIVFALLTRFHFSKRNIVVFIAGLALITLIAANYNALAQLVIHL